MIDLTATGSNGVMTGDDRRHLGARVSASTRDEGEGTVQRGG